MDHFIRLVVFSPTYSYRHAALPPPPGAYALPPFVYGGRRLPNNTANWFCLLVATTIFQALTVYAGAVTFRQLPDLQRWAADIRS